MQRATRLTPLIFVVCAIAALPSQPYAQKANRFVPSSPPSSWEAVGSGITGVRVSDLIVYDGKLVACGTFSHAGGNAASNIAAWDGTSWSALGAGLDNGAVGMAIYDGQLIVAGNFANAGGNPANRIASWDGTSWSAVGGGVATNPSAIAAYGGRVYVARNTALPPHGVQVSYLEAWTGAIWFTSTTVNADPTTDQVQINALEAAGGKLFAVGLTQYQYVLCYNGTSWSTVGAGPLNAYAIGEYGGNVIAGGYDRLLHEWDGGATWTPIDNTWPANCGWTFAIIELYGLMVAGGDYTGSCTPHPYLITWNGTTWSTLGNQGPNGRVLALAEHDARLFAAGEFTKVDNKTANLIAQWDATVPVRKMSLGELRRLYLEQRR